MPKAQVTLQVWYVLLSHWDQNIFKITFKLSCLYNISPLVNYQPFLTTNTLCIYVFCTSCEPEIVLTVLKIKTKTISGLQLVKNT